MSDGFVFVVALVAALGCGLVAGAFFAFSSFVMKALADLPPAQGIAAMQSINVAVINPVFMAAFVGSALVGVVAVITAILSWSDSGAVLLVVGSVLYIGGCFLSTMTANVPMNNAMAALDPDSAESAPAWTAYVSRWTAWNHVRTVAALAASAAFILSLAL